MLQGVKTQVGQVRSLGMTVDRKNTALFMFDELHEECGVFAIYGHPEAANLAYLGLYALQHRGQESAGIASSEAARSTPIVASDRSRIYSLPKY